MTNAHYKVRSPIRNLHVTPRRGITTKDVAGIACLVMLTALTIGGYVLNERMGSYGMVTWALCAIWCAGTIVFIILFDWWPVIAKFLGPND